MAKALDEWHRIVRERDPDGLDDLLADDVVFHSPVVHTPQRGKPITAMYLAAAVIVLGQPSFRYVREIVGASEAVLEFVVDIDGIEVNGVDLIRWNDAGPHRRLQGDGPAAEGDQPDSSEDGGGAAAGWLKGGARSLP